MAVQKITFESFLPLESQQQEEINSLYTNIRFSGHGIRSIGVTSSFENEGKTYIAMNLLRTAAADGKKAVLIDADLRKSHVWTKFGVRQIEGDGKGLTHYLCGEAEADDVLCETDIPGAYIINIGEYSATPMKLLGSPRLGELIAALCETFDYVFVDMPPINVVIDSAIIAQQCNGTLLVVRSNDTSYHSVLKAKDQLDRAGVNILGVVLNMIDPRDNRYYYRRHYGRYYYGRYYGKKKKKKQAEEPVIPEIDEISPELLPEEAAPEQTEQ